MWKDFLFLLGAAFFFMGCIASSHRSGITLRPGQYSVSGSYLRASSMEETDAESVQLIAVDGRAGLAEGLDVGLMHTFDISKGNDGAYETTWADLKVQCTNRDNVVGKPVFSVGLLKGYLIEEVDDETVEYHFTGIPLMISIPTHANITPFFMYRHMYISGKFFPEEFENPRSTFVLGAEFTLGTPSPDRWLPKLGVSIGTMNSLGGGSEGDRVLLLNFGLSVDSPPKR